MPIAPSSHLTSFCFVQGCVFAKNDNNRAVFAAFSVISDRFARFAPPNFCVQLADVKRFDWMYEMDSCALKHKELQLFLHPAMRNMLTMCFVFKMHLLFYEPREGWKKCDSGDELKSLFLLFRSRMWYLEKLSLHFDGLYGDVLHSLRSALLPALPASLQSLTIQSEQMKTQLIFDTNDILVLAALPQLRELRLIGQDCLVSNTAMCELFREVRPHEQQQQQQQLFFPKLQRLQATTAFNNFASLLKVAAASAIMPQLKELAVRTLTMRVACSVDVTALNKDLRALQNVLELGPGFMGSSVRLDGTEPLDLSPLENCVKVGDDFFHDAVCEGVLDFSPMVCLEEVASGCISHCTLKKVIVPRNVRRIGRAFALGCAIAELDLSPISYSLESIDVDWFASRSCIAQFDTTPLSGAVRGDAAFFFYDSRKLVTIDLSGLVGIVALGQSFLADCAALETVRGMDGLAAVQTTSGEFLAETVSLIECDISKMKALCEVARGFMKGSKMEESGNKMAREIAAINNNNNNNNNNKRAAVMQGFVAA